MSSTIIGKYRTAQQRDEYIGRCKKEWARLEHPNTLIILAVGDGIIEWSAYSYLLPEPKHVIPIDPSKKFSNGRKVYTYDEAQEKLASIENPRGMVIGVNVMLYPTKELSLLEMKEKLEIAKDWPAFVVYSYRTYISETKLGDIFDNSNYRHEREEKERQRRKKEFERAQREKEEQEIARLGKEEYERQQKLKKEEWERSRQEYLEKEKRREEEKKRKKNRRRGRGGLLAHFKNHAR